MPRSEGLLRHKRRHAGKSTDSPTSPKVSKSVSGLVRGVLGGEKRKRSAGDEGDYERRVAERCSARVRFFVRRGVRARSERILRGAPGPFLFFGC